MWADFYKGSVSDRELVSFLGVSDVILSGLSKVSQFRKRLVSSCVINRSVSGGWDVKRILGEPFSQELALIGGEGRDYRIEGRVFRELPDELFNSDLMSILFYVADSICFYRPSLRRMKVVIHHTLVSASPECDVSNSPEGVHQDGMDYIVSALVLERVNVTGGDSLIYGADKVSSVFKMQLQPGQGVLQPDLGSELWHEVTPIKRVDIESDGYRSTIGFDFKVLGDI